MEEAAKPHGLIVVSSGKGGVTKSTSTQAIAGALKVLGSPPDAVLDLDYGASTTRGYGYKPETPFAEALLDGRVELEKALLDTDEGIPLVGTNAGIAHVEKSKTIAWRDRLVELKKKHLIIVDTSDDIMSAPVAAAILAADILLVPTPLDKRAYERTFPEISGLLEGHKHNPEVMWFATLVDRKTAYSDHVEQMIARDGRELLARIPRGIAAAEAGSARQSVVGHAKNSKVAKAYVELARLVYARLQKLNGVKADQGGRSMPSLPVSA